MNNKVMKNLEEENQKLRKEVDELKKKIPISGKKGQTVGCSRCWRSVTLMVDIHDIRYIVCDQCAH